MLGCYKFGILCASVSRSVSRNVCLKYISQSFIEIQRFLLCFHAPVIFCLFLCFFVCFFVSLLLLLSLFFVGFFFFGGGGGVVCLFVFVCFSSTGLSAVTDRSTKSVCKQCHVLHFIVHFVALIQISCFVAILRI